MDKVKNATFLLIFTKKHKPDQNMIICFYQSGIVKIGQNQITQQT